MSLNLKTFLNKLASNELHIPIEANFVIIVNGLSDILNNLNNNSVKDVISSSGKIQTVPNKNLWQISDQESLFFANGITLPGESVTLNRVGPSSDTGGTHGGLLAAPVLKGRKDLTNLEITFFETNLSFIDSVLRPWSVATAHYGLFGRANNSSQNFKTDILINFLSKTGENKTGIRKSILFNNAAPIEIQGYEATYGGTGKSTEMRTAKTVWTYSRYQISYPAISV